MSVTQQILDIVEKKALEVNANTIKQITLVIGDASTVLDDSVQFYFDFISQDSPARGAKLFFRRVPLTVRCRHCNWEFNPKGEIWQCPHCRVWDIEIVTGQEFYVESIEVE